MRKTEKSTGPEAIMAEFYKFITDRVSTGLNDAGKSQDYKSAEKEVNDLLDAIKPHIPIELFQDLDSAINAMNVFEYDYIYRRGFFDAIDFLKCGEIPLP